MLRKKANAPPRRNALDFVRSGTKRGDVVSFRPLPPDYVTELRDNPDDFSHPLEVGRILPGVRAAVTLSGCPFEFIVRVAPDERGNPRVVDLRMHSPHTLGDVAITNADLKMISVAALAAAAMKPPIPGVEAPHEPVAHAARRPGRPKQLTDDFLRDVTRLAREAWHQPHPINDYIAAALQAEGKIRYRADNETVRGWRKAATARRRQFPDDNSFLRSGELRGKPRKDTTR